MRRTIARPARTSDGVQTGHLELPPRSLPRPHRISRHSERRRLSISNSPSPGELECRPGLLTSPLACPASTSFAIFISARTIMRRQSARVSLAALVIPARKSPGCAGLRTLRAAGAKSRSSAEDWTFSAVTVCSRRTVSAALSSFVRLEGIGAARTVPDRLPPRPTRRSLPALAAFKLAFPSPGCRTNARLDE